MTKSDILTVLKKDELDKNGEILYQNDNGVCYLDYSSCIETTYQFKDALADDFVRQLIHIGEPAKRAGLTEQFIIDVLKKSYGDDYFDTICTLSGIIIPSNEDEFYAMLNASNRTSNVIEEWYEYDEDTECIGMMLSNFQIVLINENVLRKTCEELVGASSGYEFDKEYQIAMIVTLIHEMRHLMLDTNRLLSKDKFPESESKEEAVERFCLEKYEQLGELKCFKRKDDMHE